MLNRIRSRYVHAAIAVRLSILLSLSAFVLLLGTSPLSAQVTSTPGYVIFGAPGATETFAIAVASGTTLGSFSVLTLGAPNLDFNSVASGTTCPTVTAGTCTIEVVFQPTTAGRRQGMVVLTDPSGNTLQTISLDGDGTGPLAAFDPGIISTFIGASAQLAGPTGIAVDGFGNFYIADQAANEVFEVTPAGVVSVYAGNGTAGYGGDSGPATSAELNGPMAVLVDGAGDLFIADTGNNVIREVTPDGKITTYAGQYYLTGSTPPAVCTTASDSVGDGCPPTQLIFNTPVALAMCHVQNLHIADKLNNRIRTVFKLPATPQTLTQVGNGTAGYNGDGELNTSAELNGPIGIDMDATNNIYIADSGNHIIRKTLLTGTTPNPISTVAGTPGKTGNLGDGGLATSAELNNPSDVRVDPAGNIYISDSASQVIRMVNSASGLISTMVGTGTAGNGGDGGPATSAQLNGPSGLLLDGKANLYIADSQNLVIREVDVSDGPSLSFATTPVGEASASQDVTVRNTGNTALMISKISTAANFSLGGSATSCNSSSQTLNSAASCVLGIEFTPTTVGSISGSVVLTDNLNPTSQTIALSGTGSPAPTKEAYTLTAKTPKVSMSAGSEGTATLTLNSSNYAGTVSFVTSVSSTDGTISNVKASASVVKLTAGGSGTSTVTITTSANAANHTPSAPWKSSGTLMFCAVLLATPFTFRRKRALAVLLSAVAISLAGFLMACGGGGSTKSATQAAARTYIVTLTPTGTTSSGGLVSVINPAPVSITVTVQ